MTDETPAAPPRDDAANQTLAPVWAYLALVTAASLPAWTLIIRGGALSGGGGHYTELLMWSPALAAILACAMFGIPRTSLGLSAFPLRWGLIAYLLPIAYSTAAYLFIWASGAASFPDPQVIATSAEKFGWQVASPATFMWAYIALIGVTGMVGGTARALGEEIGWRGFLSPRLTNRFGTVVGCILVGLIWAAWHMPILLLADYHGAAPWWFSLGCFAVLTIGLSFVLSWLRLRSESIWPCSILHGAHNLVLHAILSRFTLPRSPAAAYLIDEFGLPVPLMILIAAALLWGAARPDRDEGQAAVGRRGDSLRSTLLKRFA